MESCEGVYRDMRLNELKPAKSSSTIKMPFEDRLRVSMSKLNLILADLKKRSLIEKDLVECLFWRFLIHECHVEEHKELHQITKNGPFQGKKSYGGRIWVTFLMSKMRKSFIKIDPDQLIKLQSIVIVFSSFVLKRLCLIFKLDLQSFMGIFSHLNRNLYSRNGIKLVSMKVVFIYKNYG